MSSKRSSRPLKEISAAPTPQSTSLSAAHESPGTGTWLQTAVGHRSRILLSRGAFDEAIMCTLEELGPLPRSMAAELIATRALALACARRTDDALATADEAIRMSQATDTAVLSACTRAVVATNDSKPEAFAVVSEALSMARRLGCRSARLSLHCVDVRRWVRFLMDVPETRRDLMPILTFSNEHRRFAGACVQSRPQVPARGEIYPSGSRRFSNSWLTG